MAYVLGIFSVSKDMFKSLTLNIYAYGALKMYGYMLPESYSAPRPSIVPEI